MLHDTEGDRPGPSRRVRRQHRVGVGTTDPKEAVVRLSLDLSVVEHEFLKRFAYEHDVPQSYVGRALVDWLRADAEVGRTLIAKIRSQLDRTEIEQLQAILDACHRYRPDHVEAGTNQALPQAILAVCEAAEERIAALAAFLH